MAFVLLRRDVERQLQSKHVLLGPRRIMSPNSMYHLSVFALKFLFLSL